jgi:cytochrome o ubiquinol oxidase subunit 3
MSSTIVGLPPRNIDPYRLGRTGGGGHPPRLRPRESGPAPKRIVVGYGFWIFLLSDIILFSTFFAAHAVLGRAYAGGPTGHDLFDIPRVGIETACLLASSFACGLAAVALQARNMLWTQVFLLLTGLLGAGFLLLEANEFAGLINRNGGPARSAFLSSFFALVGCHGLHVTAGLLWLGTMMAQILVKGFTPRMFRRMLCFNLFWHTLDIIWVALFTVVYLIGAAA